MSHRMYLGFMKYMASPACPAEDANDPVIHQNAKEVLLLLAAAAATATATY
jgi:hypothetical protein